MASQAIEKAKKYIEELEYEYYYGSRITTNKKAKETMDLIELLKALVQESENSVNLKKV